MTTFDYTEIQAVADELINEFGQVGTVTRMAPPDPVLGGDPVETAYPATLVPLTYDARYINGTTITTADRQIYISSVGLVIAPETGDLVSAGGVQYHIVAVDPNNFDGATNVVFIIQGRIA